METRGERALHVSVRNLACALCETTSFWGIVNTEECDMIDGLKGTLCQDYIERGKNRSRETRQ
jgi:hypothetical protein